MEIQVLHMHVRGGEKRSSSTVLSFRALLALC